MRNSQLPFWISPSSGSHSFKISNNQDPSLFKYSQIPTKFVSYFCRKHNGSLRIEMLRAKKSKRNSSSPYAASNPAATRLGRGSRTQPQPPPALSTPEAPVQPVEIPVPVVTISTPTNQQFPVLATSGTVLPTSSLLSSAISNPTPLISVSDNLGNFVPQSIKEKIWSKDYIDLAKLLHTDLDTDKPDQKLSIVDGQLIMSPKTNPKKITTVDSWTDAFLIFSSIYLLRHPADIQGILKYMQTIRLGASRNPNASWLEYDRQFRLKISTNTSITWGSVDAELWLMFMSNTAVVHNTQSNSKCYDYNFKGSCSRQSCLYQHLCMYCHKNHPRIH
nr:uncharacterized protein LOC109619766 isoform X3 [Crassostrea gigas]